MKYAADLVSLRDKIVLLRVDLNGDSRDANNLRFLRAASAINALLSKGARSVVILAHYGRPQALNMEYSLQPFAHVLAKLCLESVIFIDSLLFSDIREVILHGKSRIYLVENLRFFSGEEANDVAFAEELASLGDLYVNDAFSVSHRAHASVSAITHFLPSFAGYNLANEMLSLNKVFTTKEKPFTLILGGAKIGDKLHYLKKLIARAQYVLLGGGVANTFLAAQHEDVGDSLVDLDVLPHLKPFLRLKKFIFPVDYVREGNRILDIGSETQTRYASIILESRIIVWSGPMGNIEVRKFQSGSVAVARAIALSKAFSIVGGGDTVSVVSHLNLIPKFSFVSTGGSALLQFLELKTLPGIEALKKSRVKL